MDNPDYSLHYSQFHPDTDEHQILVVRAVTEWLKPLMPDDKSGAVLDIGCGFGYALLAAQSLGFQKVEGVEQSPQQAARARQYGLNVAVTDDTPNWLSQRQGKFATILLLDVLEHIPVESQIDFLKAVYSSMTIGGRMVVKTPNANSILASRWRYIDYTHHCSFTEHSLRFVLTSAGFIDIQMQVQSTTRPSLRLWKKTERKSFLPSLRRYLVRKAWKHVYMAELPDEDLSDMSFELNHMAIVYKH